MLAATGQHGADPTPHAFLIAAGEAARRRGLALAERLRDEAPALRLRMNCGGGGFKAQFRRADHSGARFALILGEDEVRDGVVAIKPLRDAQGEQMTLSRGQTAAHLRAVLDLTP
jgi:histidyl-tRNA synthetase